MKWTLPMAHLLVAVVPLSHAATVHSNKLPPPKNMTCLQVKQAISYTITRGMLHIPWDIELGRGAYVSEHEDVSGVYYRAPSGMITQRRTDKKETSMEGRRMTFEGGIYVPNDATAAPTLYQYYGTIAAATQPATDNTNCESLNYAVDPNTHKVNVWATGVAFGIGAATGTAVGHLTHPQMHSSYGQAAGTGLIGGLIGGLIIGAIENSKADEIVAGPPLNSETSEKIKMLASGKMPMTERGQPTSSNAAITVPAPSNSQPTPPQGAPNAEMQANTGIATVVPAAVASTATLPTAAIATSDSPTASQAQGVANQLGCGTVKADSTGGYVASCGSYGVFIDCNTGRCHPTHTVKLEEGK